MGDWLAADKIRLVFGNNCNWLLKKSTGITTSIKNTRYNCRRCNSSSPSQAKEPLITSKSPEYPFQCVCADYLEIKGHHYLVIVDCFSSWITIYYFPPMKLNSKTLIGTFRELFINYGIPDDNAARAILQHRNTPLSDINLSPAQILFHRQLRAQLPAKPNHYHLHKD